MDSRQASTHLVFTVAVLCLFGLLAVYSSSAVSAYQKYGDSFFFLKKQSLGLFLGIIVFIVLQIIPERWISRCNLPLFFVALILLTLTLVSATQITVKGASRWISLSGFRYQPVELAKLALIIFLAKNLSRTSCRLSEWPSVVSNILPFTLLAIPLMLQPDFGSCFLLFTVAFSMLISTGLRVKYIVATCLLAISGVATAILLAPYRLARVLSFLDPIKEAQRGGFQIIQSYLGFKNGGLLGQGFGGSKQKLYFLPEAHTDFIIAVIAEEAGLFGILFVIYSFYVIIKCSANLVQFQTDSYKRNLLFGFTCLIGYQASINIGVAMGLLPTKGMSLPFVSSGSSSLLLFLTIVGIIYRIGTSEEKHAPP